MVGELSYFEIPAKDGDRAKAFWSALLDWSFESSHVPDYAMIGGVTPIGGMSLNDPSEHPRVFFTVTDINDGIARVKGLGGRAEAAVEIPSGWFARCQDDQQVHFTLWQDRTET